MRRKPNLLLLVVIATILASPAIAAEEARHERKDFDATPITSRWRVWAGGGLNNVTTEVGFTPTGLIGGLIRLEDDLGLEDNVSSTSVGASVRIGRHHRLQLAIDDINRTSRQRLDKSFEFGDYVFDVGAEIRTEFRTTMVKFKWKYSLSNSRRLDAGLSAGLSTFALALSLEGEATLDIDGEAQGELAEAAEGQQFLAPVPLIGFYLNYAFTPRIIIRVGADALDLSFAEHRGRVLESNFLMEFYVSDLAGIGVGVTTTDIEYGRKVDQEQLDIRYRISSFVGYFSYVF